MEPIVACATPWGRSAVALVRLSGSDLQPILSQICVPKGGFPPPRRARLCRLVEGGTAFDEGLLTLFSAGASYTGEAAAEITCHGNPVVVERLLAAAVAAGARMAHPGEFTRRAFLNGRMDLPRAEAVLQAIEASTPGGVALARAGLDGAVSSLVEELRGEIVEILAELEAELDFPQEAEFTMNTAQLLEKLGALSARAQSAVDSWRSGRILVEGARVALVGPVNAGKSSLFNALGGSVRALVSEEPGTTRDVLERRVVLDNVAVILLDSAGERSGAEGLEAEGMALGRILTEDVDLTVVVIPSHAPEQAAAVLERTVGRPRILVANHADRPGIQLEPGWIPTCALDGTGLDRLGAAISEALVGDQRDVVQLIASQRQRDLLVEVVRALGACGEAATGDSGCAVAAEELYRALERLDALSGADTREEVLDALFSRFCIGK